MIQLTKEQAEAILAYLLTRPAGEVMNAVVWLQLAINPPQETQV